MNTKARFLIGSYSEAQGVMVGARGEGVSVVDLDTETGEIARVSCCAEIINPSYLAKDPDQPDLFLAVSENFDRDGVVTSLKLLPDGKVEILDQRNCPGRADCHVMKLGRFVFIASYESGLLNVFPSSGGILGEMVQQIQYAGSSVNRERQESPHAHQAAASPCGKRLYVCDLGSDVVWSHHMTANGIEPEEVALKTPDGTGPRHLHFHPTLPIVYILCELTNEILLCQWDEATGTLTLKARIPGLPEIPPNTSAAAIHLDARRMNLYTSYRVANRIAVHKIQRDGSLVFEYDFTSGGNGPRDFGLEPSGNWLVSANQHSSTLCSYRLDSQGHAKVPAFNSQQIGTPVCVLAV